MKKILLISMLLIAAALSALEVENEIYETEIRNGYTYITSSTALVYNQESGSPSIPQIAFFIDLNGAADLTKVKVKALQTKQIDLEKSLYPVQQPAAFSMKKNDFTSLSARYEKGVFPESWLQDYKSSGCGSSNIGIIVIAGAKYDADNMKLLIPEKFSIEYETQGSYETVFQDNYAVEKVKEELGLPCQAREADGYLVIAPLMFENALQPLMDWRQRQGYNVFFRSTGDIASEYTGEDLAAKIRACIIDLQSSEGIDLVTLAGDTGHIPTRYAFAFDCSYGAHAGENDLACDMYYSCLDGNWNADADTLYGEDEDETDLLPEVFVGRIPANDSNDIASYTARLTAYEKGLVDDYERAGGMSMELWEGAASEECQLYIYDNYFPAYYNIDFLYGAENTLDNALNMISAGQNIIQHTGHAWSNQLGLENQNRIYINDLEDLTNDWGGLLYSIGCWSLAFDYDSIGEGFVRNAEHNLLGYIGNSSYGWGAPGAASFGFSEFYQKEFFRLLFTESNGQLLSEIQSLQKIAFVPYFTGTSVFKWVGYELNLSGDAAAYLYTGNPGNLDISVNLLNEELVIGVYDGNNPVENAVISSNDERWFTAADGTTQIPWQSGMEFSYSVYKQNYRWEQISNHDIVQQPLLQITDYSESIEINEEEEVSLSFVNVTDSVLTFTLNAESNPPDLQLTYDQQMLYSAAAGEEIFLEDVILYYDGSSNLQNATPFTLNFSAENLNGEIIAAAALVLELHSADVELTFVNWDEEDFLPGNYLPFEFGFTSNCFMQDIQNITFDYLPSQDGLLNFIPAQSIIYPWQWNASDIINTFGEMNISDDLPQDYSTSLKVRITINWGEDKSWSREFGYIAGNSNLQLSEDFQLELDWNGDDEWQRVNNYYVSPFYSLSCRPSAVGNYTISTPLLTWGNNSELSFNYRFQMPMYGEDGVLVSFVSDDITQDIVFLGSGGALPKTDSERPPANVYIEGDWQEYSFDLQEILLDIPDYGSSYQLVFDFNYSEIIEGFNQYDLMPEIGIFIDDLEIRQSGFTDSENLNFAPSSLQVFPNPFIAGNNRSFLTLAFELDKAQNIEICLFDIRGRLARRLPQQYLQSGRQCIEVNAGRLPSGIYMLQIKTETQRNMSKLLILR